MASADLEDTFLFGAHVYRVPPVSLDHVRADLATMKRLGMNLVNLQESWSWDNPMPGVYDFGDIAALIEEAGRLGLLASVSITLEVLPKWVWDKYPGARLLNAYGEPHDDPTQYVMPADGKPGPCWDHPGVKREAKKFLVALCRRLAGYENLAYWNVWQEIGLWCQRPGATRPQALMPYNPETLRAFRAYLKERFGALHKLNAAWRTRFGKWDEVEPPRMYFQAASFTDWAKFIHEGYLAEAVRWRCAVLREADPRRRPIAFHTAAPFYGSTCEHVWSKHADWYGTSYYPTVLIGFDWGRGEGPLTEAEYRPQELWVSLFMLNYSRCANGAGRRFLMSEFATGPYNAPLNAKGEVTAADLRRWLLLQLAAGSQGGIGWNTRPEHFWAEAQGQGFLDGDGGVTPRAEVLGRFGAAVAKHGTLLARAVKPLAPVALFLDEDLHRFMEGTGVNHHLIALRACYWACLRAGADPDFVDGNRSAPEDLARHRVIILPFPLAMSEATVAKLRQYVEQGGTLISGPAPARFDEHGWAYLRCLSPAAEELFGVRAAGLRQVAEHNGKRRWTPAETRPGDVHPPVTLSGAGPLAGLNPKAAFWVQTYALRDAEPLLKWDERVCGATRRLGRGRIHLLGTLFGFALLGEECEATQKALEVLLAGAQVPSDRSGSVVRLRRVWKDRELWSLVNLVGAPAAWTVPPGTKMAEDLLTGEQFRSGSRVDVEGYDLRTLVVSAN